MLRTAAAAKHTAAVQRAESGLRQLVKDGAEINFRSVARAGPVSLDFLYAEPELRARIEHLRAQQLGRARRSSPGPATAPTDDGNVVRTLRSELQAEKARRQGQVREIEEKLAAAHGEILRLRRVLEAAGLEG